MINVMLHWNTPGKIQLTLVLHLQNKDVVLAHLCDECSSLDFLWD